MVQDALDFLADLEIPQLSGEEVRMIREGLNWTQKGLARALGLGVGGQKTVSAWETGQRVPGPVTIALLAIADGFRISQSPAVYNITKGAQGRPAGSVDRQAPQVTPSGLEGPEAARRIRELAQQILDITNDSGRE